LKKFSDDGVFDTEEKNPGRQGLDCIVIAESLPEQKELYRKHDKL